MTIALGLLVASSGAVACGDVEVVGAPAEARSSSAEGTGAREGESRGGEPEVVDSRPPPMHQPIPRWDGGRAGEMVDAATARENGFVVLDLGEEWTPYLFTTRGNASEPEVSNAYRTTYLALARGEFPDDHHGDRARSDKYLELYGIMPTLGLIRERMRHTSRLACARELDLTPLQEFEGFIRYESRDSGRNFARQVRYLENQVAALARRQNVASPDQIDPENLSTRDARRFADWQRVIQEYRVISAAQQRLECEGYFEGKGAHVDGGLDWATHEALAEFERRHRVYGWGFIGRDTLEALRRTPMEGEQEAVIRVMTERAMHAAGVIEDGSVGERTFRGEDGAQHPVPNLEGQVRSMVIEAFGLQTPDSTLAFLEQLGELGPEEERLVAFRGPELPEYYGGNMDLSVEIDRGDVWYEFPYDEQGRERGQPTERRPRLTIFASYRGQRIPLARFGTTVGGWRTESIEGETWWRYKNSPVGEVIWHQIVASPVWLPPESTPPRDLVSRVPRGRGANAYRVNYHEVGPSYASAYGLVAAYHIRYRERDGEIIHGHDEGIRTHGSVDYMSIMRRHSHGCHRLHNHMAVRLMSFVLAHRRHVRVGQQALGFRRNLEVDGETYEMALDRGGYVFQLERPIHVAVLEGRVRGDRATPIADPLPRWSSDVGAYMLPDGGAVAITRSGTMTSIPVPLPDAGVLAPGLDGGVRMPIAPTMPIAPVLPPPVAPR
ncbi:MAG: peptidoglycan-binding protein [Myxococcota bacterium]|nr:peptidoglycan-binding protein [Myxococcota bacterium]